MIAVWDDPRIRRGMTLQLDARRRQLDLGAKPLGWKVAFGTRAAQRPIGVSGPLIGFLLDISLLATGSTVAAQAWHQPVVEPEIAIHLGSEVPPGADLPRVRACIGGLGAALELADLTSSAPFADIQALIAGNLFQRHVILGPIDPSRAGARLDGLDERVISIAHNRDSVGIEDVTVLTGDLVHVAAHVARMLEAFGVSLCAGDVIIAGACAPPVLCRPGDHVRFSAGTLGALEVSFSGH